MHILRINLHAFIAICAVLASAPVTSNAQEISQEDDPAAVVCELSRFGGATARQSGFSRLSWSMAGDTISALFASNDGRTVEAECRFKMADGEIVFADNVARQVIDPLKKAGLYPIDPTKTVLYFEQ